MKDINTLLLDYNYNIQKDEIFNKIKVGDYFYDKDGHKWTIRVKKPRGCELYDDPSNGIYNVVPVGIEKYKNRNIIIVEGENGFMPDSGKSGHYRDSLMYRTLSRYNPPIHLTENFC